MSDVQQAVLAMMERDGFTVEMLLCKDCGATWTTTPGMGRLRMVEGRAKPRPCERHRGGDTDMPIAGP